MDVIPLPWNIDRHIRLPKGVSLMMLPPLPKDQFHFDARWLESTLERVGLLGRFVRLAR